jgi:regulator of protease activity HflC (stomatin/prohibitin superfamily)
MYVIDNWWKFVLCLVLIGGMTVASNHYLQADQVTRTEVAMEQMAPWGADVQQEMLRDHAFRNNALVAGWAAVLVLCGLVFLGDARRALRGASAASAAGLLLLVTASGCRKPFEPVKLEVIKSNEEAFLLPLTAEGKKQASSDNEAYLKENLVYTKQVQIPQQWVPRGYETFGYNGEWHDAALLIKVDKSPVTREWTADTNSGTSTRNEAIWVMTSDQVEFSTGWTCTARIAGRDDAVKFLHNYPNGSLTTVLDTEVRSKLQAEFGLEVTDLPMETLRKAATPHLVKTTKAVTEFFKDRGITITNLGITGGFVYKDRSILDTMVKVFNAEQERAIAVAATNAQKERNQAVILKAQGEADAVLKTKQAEADGIKMVGDARKYELEIAKANPGPYLQLKQLELQRELLHKWDGSFPRYFMSSGAAASPHMLLQLPPVDSKNGD